MRRKREIRSLVRGGESGRSGVLLEEEKEGDQESC